MEEIFEDDIENGWSTSSYFYTIGTAAQKITFFKKLRCARTMCSQI